MALTCSKDGSECGNNNFEGKYSALAVKGLKTNRHFVMPLVE